MLFAVLRRQELEILTKSELVPAIADSEHVVQDAYHQVFGN
jgi:hypothetical protein